MITADENLGFLKSIVTYTNFFPAALNLKDHTPRRGEGRRGRCFRESQTATYGWLKRRTSSKRSQPTKRRTARRPYCQPRVSYCFILIGHDNIVPLLLSLLQTGLNGHHRLLYPVETQNASSSKHEEREREKKERIKRRRGYLKT